MAWDLCHYGWPDHLDVFSAAFVEHFARYAAAFARLHLEETGRPPLVCPINEISYLAWAGGEVARMNPGPRGRGAELKRQLVLATLAATLRNVSTTLIQPGLEFRLGLVAWVECPWTGSGGRSLL